MFAIRPRTYLFGVKFYDTFDERPAKTQHPAHPMNVCQVTALTRYYGRSMYFTNELTFEPDIVVAYGNTSQAMRIVQAYLWKRGGRVGFSTGGEYSLCADTLADTYNKQDLSVAIPCFGDRRTGLA